MGPTNKALLELFRADTALRLAQANLDAATRGVRVQRKRAELAAKAHADTAGRLKHARAQQMELDSDLKARDARIEHLRQQQQGVHNHKQYQAFLIEISTQKTDRGKIEEQAVAKLAEVEALQAQEAQQHELALAEHQRAEKLNAEIAAKTTELRLDIERLQPDRDAAAARVPAAALALFDKLADNYDGEALSGVGHIEGRTEGYYCTACNMELVVDVYNRLMTRDEVLSCPGCGRLLYVPEELTPEKAVRQKKAVKAPARKRAEPKDRPRKRGARVERTTRALSADVRRILTTAAAEALRQAELAGQAPVEAELFIGGESAGIFKVHSAESLRRLVIAKMQAEDIELEVAAKQVGGDLPVREADSAPHVQPVPDRSPHIAPPPSRQEVPVAGDNDAEADESDGDEENGEPVHRHERGEHVAPGIVAREGERRAMVDTAVGDVPSSPQ